MNFKYVLVFLGGGIAGYFVGQYVTNKKRREEQSEMRELFRQKQNEIAGKNNIQPSPAVLNDLMTEDIPEDELREKYKQVLSKYRPTEDEEDEIEYEILTPHAEEEPEIPDVVPGRPENKKIISADEYFEQNGYFKENLDYYSDDVLAEEISDDIVVVDETIGDEAYDILKTRPDEALYVRNEETRTDYEIIYSKLKYSEVTGIYVGGMDE